MLVLTRKRGERFIVAGDITVEVLEVRGNCVRVGITAPGEVKVLRGEVWLKSKEADCGEQAGG